MIKNSIYTYDYFQPEEYRFSLDSVFLAQKVADLIKTESNLDQWRTLDLCAGCGIIGFELSLHSAKLSQFDFLEVQNLYLSFFEKNRQMIHPNRIHDFQFLNLNYQDLLQTKYENTYDLIVSNPPYFFKGEGLLSPNDFKNRCRFFLDSDFKTSIEATLFTLKPKAKAYLLVREGNHHGRNLLEDMKTILAKRGSAQFIDNVRGTDIVQIQKEIF